MATVRMKIDFHANRVPGEPWPAYNELLECSDWEAHRLVNAGHAVYAEYEPVADPGGFRQLAPLVDENYRIGNPDAEAPKIADEIEQDEAPAPGKRPYANHRREAWVEWAVSQGEPRESAEAMTKDGLIEKYGASL